MSYYDQFVDSRHDYFCDESNDYLRLRLQETDDKMIKEAIEEVIAQLYSDKPLDVDLLLRDLKYLSEELDITLPKKDLTIARKS